LRRSAITAIRLWSLPHARVRLPSHCVRNLKRSRHRTDDGLRPDPMTWAPAAAARRAGVRPPWTRRPLITVSWPATTRDHFPNSHAIGSEQPTSGTTGLSAKNQGQRRQARNCQGYGPSHSRNPVMDARDDVASTNFCNGAQFEPFPELLRGA
jgi:hypothetical protein